MVLELAVCLNNIPQQYYYSSIYVHFGKLYIYIYIYIYIYGCFGVPVFMYISVHIDLYVCVFMI